VADDGQKSRPLLHIFARFRVIPKAGAVTGQCAPGIAFDHLDGGMASHGLAGVEQVGNAHLLATKAGNFGDERTLVKLLEDAKAAR
jgi:hypothetical protein